MKTSRLLSTVSAFVLVLFGLVFADGSFAIADVQTIYPTTISDITGGWSDWVLIEPALSTQDQSGSDEADGSSVWFYAADEGFRGTLQFQVPSDVVSSQLDSLTINTNYRGESGDSQVWSWQLKDVGTGNWETIGTNAGAGNWTWAPLTFTVSDNPARFVAADNRIELRYITLASDGGANDDSHLDFLAIVLTSSESEPPANPQNGDLVLSQNLSIDPTAPLVGDSLQASFTIHNTGQQSITLNELGVDGRGPGCSATGWSCTDYQGFAYSGAMTLAPGEQRSITGSSSALETEGNYFYKVVYQDANGEWTHIGNQIDLTVTTTPVNPPQAETLSLTQNLSIDPTAPIINDPLQASFTIRNSSSQPVTLNELAIDGRGPGCSLADWDCANYQTFGYQGSITLAPNEGRSFSGTSNALQAEGSYFYKVVYQNSSGEWKHIGNLVELSVTTAPVNPPSDEIISLTQDLNINLAAPRVGDSLEASFTVRNNSNQPLALNELAIDGRGPSCTLQDWSCADYQGFGYRGSITLAAGEERPITASSNALQTEGSYFYKVVYQDANGEWAHIGNLIELTVSEAETSPPNPSGNYYVAPDGVDAADRGTINQPWRTIQYAVDNVSAGNTVNVRQGTYNELVTINASGTSEQERITIQSYLGETAIIDANGLSASSGSAVFKIEDQRYVTIKGFDIQNFKTSAQYETPIGILVTGASSHIKLLKNRIHNIENNGGGQNDWNAHGIAVFGTNSGQSINNITISGNELYDLVLGASEALVLNGNVDGFLVEYNTVRDVNNIAIDVIGWEGIAGNSSTDYARNGTIRGNTVTNVSAYGNPAYGNVYAAGGIYVDGGANITIEQNTVSYADFGIELASENPGRTTDSITVRNNVISYSNLAGISIGGYELGRGSTTNSTIVNNTFYNNDVQDTYFGELYLQYNTRNNTIQNNIFAADAGAIFIRDEYSAQENSGGNTISHNLYHVTAGENSGTWAWAGQEYYALNDFRNSTGNAQNSLVIDPQFTSTEPFLRLENTSPAINQGIANPNVGEEDIDGDARNIGGIDIGADEVTNPARVLQGEPIAKPEQTHLFLPVAMSEQNN